MWVGFTSPAWTAAFGFPVRNGSTSTVVPPSDSSKQAWPRKRMSIFSSCRCGLRRLEFPGQLPSHGDAHEHPDPGLLGEERADGADPLLLVGLRGRLQDLALVKLSEPPALLERLREDPLELGRDPRYARLRL